MQDALTRRCGVSDVKIHIQSNWVTIRPAVDRFVPLEQVGPSIRSAGFVPGEVHLRAVGTFAAGEGGSTFQVRGWPVKFAVTGDQAPGEREIWAKWTPEKDGPGRIEITTGP